MSIVGKVVRVLTHALMYISYIAVLALLTLTVVDVIRRLIFGMTITGVPEWSMILLIISMTAMAHTLIEGRFIGVSTFVEKFPKPVNLALEILMGLISLVFFILIGWRLIGNIESSIRFREAYFMIGVPRWPMLLVLGVSFLATALATIIYLYERVVKHLSPDQEDDVLGDPEVAFLLRDEKKQEEGAE